MQLETKKKLFKINNLDEDEKLDPIEAVENLVVEEYFALICQALSESEIDLNADVGLLF